MTRCSLCPGTKTCVPPDGPCNNYTIFALFEAPGFNEDKKGKPLVGKAGQETRQHYFPLAGINPDTVHLDNVISCMPISSEGKLDAKRRADIELMQCCAAHHIYPELERAKPELIIACGVFACMALDPTINLELHHGIPRETKWGWVFPMFHPAGGIHEPKRMLHIRTDWDVLRRWMRHYWNPAVDEYAGFEDYQHLSKPNEIHESLEGEWDKPLGADTEITHSRDPYCLSYSTRPGTGYVIKADDPEALAAFQSELDNWRGKILFHNWLFDSDVVDLMGLTFNRRLIVDTMERVYHLGNMPQGLKALALRELGMQMQDFDDLVRPYSTPIAVDYFRRALAEEWEKPPEELYKDFKTGEWKIKKPQGMKTKFKRFLTDLQKNPDKDPFAMWDDNWSESHQMIESVMGPFPGMCISAVPWDKAIHYSGRDADALVRLYPLLEHMAKQVRKKPQEKWREGL